MSRIRARGCQRGGVLIVVAAFAAVAAVQAAQKLSIQPEYRVGQQLTYSWHLENTLKWSPPNQGTDWGKMTTDFTFTLTARQLLDTGGCLFDIQGDNLESIGESAKGAIGIRATPTEASLRLGKHWLPPGKKTPLSAPMTLTLGPQFQAVASTGLEPLALYFLPTVDPRLWFVLTTAPPWPVDPGSTWDEEFDVPIPGARTPVQAGATVIVDGLETWQGHEVVTLRLEARISLEDIDITTKTGETMHIVEGEYVAIGVVRWDANQGLLRFAEANQSLRGVADRPRRTTLNSSANSVLELTHIH